MFIYLRVWIFTFSFFQITYSFKTPKHDLYFYYKAHKSVFLANPYNHTSFYGIHVAGETIYIDVPKSVVNVFDILNWEVINLNKDRLMFVHNKKPQILINQKTIKQMKFHRELSDSIIAFGDNEALHVPTILNPTLTQPSHKWNYIELLYFNVDSEKVSVIRSLPWLKDDDWKFIKEWKMTDYSHFDNKLYLAMKRQIWNETKKIVTREISIIQLCLDKGSDLISSAVEIYFTPGSFIDFNNMIDLLFFVQPGPVWNETFRYQLHTTSLTNRIKAQFHFFTIENFVSLFEQTVKECASRANSVTLLRYHLRSEDGKCNETSYVNCSTKENIVPSRNVNFSVQSYGTKIMDNILTSIYVFSIQIVTIPYPYYSKRLILHTKVYANTSLCRLPTVTMACINISPLLDEFLEADLHINKHPFGYFYVTKETNQILFGKIDLCGDLKICTQCIMYGLYHNCIWSNTECINDDQPKSKAALTVNNCFNIIDITPLIFNSSLPTTLTIELDKPIDPLSESHEYLVIQAGHNNCTNIKRSGKFINCTLNLLESGKFKIDICLRNDEYVDASTLSAVSYDSVDIFVPEVEYDNRFTEIFILFLSLLIFNSFLFIAYKKFNKEKPNRRKRFYPTRKGKRFFGSQSAITRVRAQIASFTVNTLTNTTSSSEPSSKQVSSWSNKRSASYRLY